MFSFFTLVAMAAVPALLYLWLAAPRLLAHVRQPGEPLSAQVFDAEFLVEAGSWLDGRELHEAFKATSHRLQLIELRRGPLELTRLPSVKLRAGDRLLVRDTAPNLKEIEASLRAKLHDTQVDEAPRDDAPPDDEEAPASAIVAQMIVTPESPLVGRSVRQQRIAERYGMAVVGLRTRRRAGWQREDLSGRRLEPGDILLLQGDAAVIQQAQRDDVGLLLDAQISLPRQHKSAWAVWTMVAVVLLAALKLLPISLAALIGVLLLLASRSLAWQDVGSSLSINVVLMVAASLALGDALDLSGATVYLARQLAVQASGLGPAWLLALLMALIGVLTNFVSNNAAAAIGTPLSVELARSLGVAPEPFVLAVLFGCNLCYATPMGYQTNLLVMNAGGYRFTDFVRVGVPLFVIMWAGLSYGLVNRYGL
jgi:di/tricarboxylate transporter